MINPEPAGGHILCVIYFMKSMEENGMIDNYIHYEVTAAHSPHHQVFWIKDDGETIFFGADDASQLQQMKHRFIARVILMGKKRWSYGSNGGREGRKKNGPSSFTMM